jgi:hypothetical protein
MPGWQTEEYDLMSVERTISGVFDPHDLRVMQRAFRATENNHEARLGEHNELLARTIVRLYRYGLIDAQKLSEVALIILSRSY